MNSPQSRPVPGKPVVPITRHSYWPCCPKEASVQSGPQGQVRSVVGPHTPFFEGAHLSLPLTYILKVIEPGTCRVVSSSRMAGPEEALAALRLLGPTRHQAVLISQSEAQFFPRVRERD